MAMKQTQTKLFDFSDVGLDFCAGSKNLFPDRFKKMLALGYNEQTVSSVAVAGNQVTLSYGVSHGYAADRVLKVNSGALASINGGEFWIDSVTTNTVTFTLDDAPTSISGGFATKIAPLGWELVYELNLVHIYKMKYLDERDLFVRMVFPQNNNSIGLVNVCIGKTADLMAGVINDPNSLEEYRSNTGVLAGFGWALSYLASSTANNYTFAQGFGIYGKACLIGSKYHAVLMASNGHTGNYAGYTFGILPAATHDYDVLDYPVLVGAYSSSALTTNSSITHLSDIADKSHLYVGKIPISIDSSISANNVANSSTNKTISTFLSEDIDSFNTTTASNIMILEKKTKQHLGFIAAGLYRFEAKPDAAPPSTRGESPSTTMDVDLSSILKIHVSHTSSNPSSGVWFCAPIEEVKIV